MVSLVRMLKSFGQPAPSDAGHSDSHTQSAAQDNDLPSIHYPSQISEQDADGNDSVSTMESENVHDTDQLNRNNQQHRANRVVDAVSQVNNNLAPTPLTDRYIELKKDFRHPNRPPFDMTTLWQLKYGVLPIMTELVNVVNIQTLNSMPIEAVAILDRINHKLQRYREWSEELNGTQQEWVCERQYVIDKLISESIPEALTHYEQLLRFSPHRTKNNTVQGNMTAGDMLTDLFLEIDYELDELLDELHQIVLNKLASTHRYVKSRTQS